MPEKLHRLVLMGFYPRLRMSKISHPFQERASALLQRLKVSGLGTKSHEDGSRENLVVLGDMM